MTLVKWIYCPSEGSLLILGEWDKVDGSDFGSLYFTDSLEEAQRWARALRAGRIPSDAHLRGGPSGLPEPHPQGSQRAGDQRLRGVIPRTPAGRPRWSGRSWHVIGSPCGEPDGTPSCRGDAAAVAIQCVGGAAADGRLQAGSERLVGQALELELELELTRSR